MFRHLHLALLVLTLLLPSAAWAGPVTNSATGSTDGVPLDATQATVTLDRVGGVVSSAMAEIWPNVGLTGQPGQPFVYDLMPTIGAGDTGIQTVQLGVPPGFTNAGITGVSVGGSALTQNCPAPGPGEFCPTTTPGTIDFLLGTRVTVDRTPIRLQFTCDTPAAAGSFDFVSTLIDGAQSAPTLPGDADGDPSDANSITVDISQTQGQVLQIDKVAGKSEVLIGDVVTYSVVVRNPQTFDVVNVSLDDRTPSAFKYLKGSTRVNGAPAPDPATGRPLRFALGTIPAWNDLDADGTVDPGEPGYVLLSYQLVVGSGAAPGNHDNVAVARDFCPSCDISNVASSRVRVTLDPLFDLGTIIGKVFDDRDGDGLQGEDEPGVPQAMVALDDGTYALTDDYGRYHFPAVIPGNRLLKINLHSLPVGTEPTTDVRRVVSVTPGLLARANFGVRLLAHVERIGKPAEYGLALSPERVETPIELQGNAETLALLINGTAVQLESRGVRMRLESADDRVRILSGKLVGEPAFTLSGEQLERVVGWRLVVVSADETPVRTLSGSGPPPGRLLWDARGDGGELLPGGEIYHYWIELNYDDGGEAVSERRMLGVNRTSAVSLTLTGNAFDTGEATLSDPAKAALDEAAEVLRRFPDETVIIEGHTDSVGSTSSNLELSRRRAESAKSYLTAELGLPGERLVLTGHGEERPVVTNALPEGRALNRRVEIRGQFTEVDEAAMLDAPRMAPRVEIEGTEIEPDDRGRFRTSIDGPDLSRLQVEMADSQGRGIRMEVRIPTIEIERPSRELLVSYGATAEGCRAQPDGTGLSCRVQGRTEPGNRLTLDGEPLNVAADGGFAFDAELPVGRTTFALLATNTAEVTRFANLHILVDDRDAEGELLVAVEPVPNLTVALPPPGLRLPSRTLELRGSTDPGNAVRVNGSSVEVDGEGRFEAALELSPGASRLTIEAEDSAGRVGKIERDVEVARHQLFLLAFADGKIGQFKADGAVAEDRVDGDEDLFTEGRLAFYLKGKIAGKYLITSALDTGNQELEPLFGDLDAEETQRLLTQIDSDRFYPVYGDASTVVHEVESRGRFYLAVESETIHAVVGNYPLQLTDAELARYQRTLHGARFDYRSASDNTEVVLFVADVEQEHVQDELRATGGSLYYLSHRDVIEGSEQVTLVTRDETTGLVLERRRQQRDLDYNIKYPEGRVVFNRPVSSVAFDSTPTSQTILAGRPVFVQIDYETRVPRFDKTASGGRLRRKVGRHLSVGGTYIQDELQTGAYELEAVDVEVQAGKGSRLTAEVARSHGSDARVFVSDDGGLTYNAVATTGTQEGTAWKATAELDVGAWFGTPGKHELDVYFKELEAGFFSGGNAREQGTRKSGAIGRFAVTAADSIELRHEREEREAGVLASPGAARESMTSSLLWRHAAKRWNLDVEFLSTETKDDAGNVLLSSDLGAVRFGTRFGDKLHARVEHQHTLDGVGNDQSSLGLRYQALPGLALDLKGTHGDQGSSGQAGVILDLGEGSVYLTERVTSQAGGRSESTVLGARSPIGEGSEVYTEYQLERSDSGERAVSLLGVQRQWDPGPQFRVRLSGERSDVDSAAGPEQRTAVAASLSFQDPEGLTVQTRNEIRLDNGAQDRVQWTTFNKLDYRFDPSLTLLARHRYSKSRDRDANSTEARLEERSLGLAYRPVTHDRFNLLAKYTRLLDQRPNELNRTMDVLAVETAFQLRPRVEWVAKLAGRVTEEQFQGRPTVETRSLLTIQRFNVTLRDPFDLGLEYRMLTQDKADDRRQGWLSELTWKVHTHFRLGLGYNFTDFSDNELSTNDASLQGWFFRVQGVY